MTLQELDRYFRSLLNLDAWAARDNSSNGLQVARKNPEVKRVAFAVDACMASFERAVAEGADVLFVHHGLFWGRVNTLTGNYYERIRYLMDHDLALYAAHLPLDAHPEVGNNYGMAQALGLTDLEPFGEYKGAKIGVKGRFPQPESLDRVTDLLFHGRENVLQILPFGKKQISSVGLVSGGATWETLQAIEEGLDLYITGDAAHEVYHPALEAGINVIFGGHYSTETWGVRLLAKRLTADTGLPAAFLDLPTGL